jgi:Arc/MetJ-type ribon-helix-helix transcriptional regulator
MAQRSIRFSETTLQQIRQAVKQKGFKSAAAMIRHAVDQELTGGDGVGQHIAATLNQIQGDLSRIHRVQQTEFAFVDTLAKTLLTGSPDQSSASVVKGKERYERFLKTAAAILSNGLHPILRDGVER